MDVNGMRIDIVELGHYIVIPVIVWGVKSLKTFFKNKAAGEIVAVVQAKMKQPEFMEDVAKAVVLEINGRYASGQQLNDVEIKLTSRHDKLEENFTAQHNRLEYKIDAFMKAADDDRLKRDSEHALNTKRLDLLSENQGKLQSHFGDLPCGDHTTHSSSRRRKVK